MESLFDQVFWARVQSAQNRGQRKGQAVFNVSFDMYPELVRQIATTDSDPFYNDRKIPEFLERLVDLLTK